MSWIPRNHSRKFGARPVASRTRSARGNCGSSSACAQELAKSFTGRRSSGRRLIANHGYENTQELDPAGNAKRDQFVDWGKR